MKYPSKETLDKLLAYFPKTGHLFWRYRPGDKAFNNRNGGEEVRCLNGNGYVLLRINKCNLRAHIVAWIMHYGEPPNSHIDHINRVPDDNRISNLRKTSRNGNMQNSKFRVNNTSGYKGVWERYGKWAADIWVNGKKKSLGVHVFKEQAAAVYDWNAAQLHGKFAATNGSVYFL